jgi:integrase
MGASMPLTVKEVMNAKPAAADYKLPDGGGLYLFVTTKGAKSWRMKYRFGARGDGKRGLKERRLTFGLFPEVSLAEARDRRDDAKKLLRAGKDPAAEAERQRIAARQSAGTTFEPVARAWHEDEKPRWSPDQQDLVLRALERDIFPEFGKVPIADIDGPTILATLRKIEGRGSIETAKRVKGYVYAVFERAIGEHLLPGDDPKNPAEKVGKALKPTPKGAKQPALTEIDRLRALCCAVDTSSASPITKIGSRLLVLSLLRVGVLCSSSWPEIQAIDWGDPDATAPDALWKVSAERMKLEVEEKGDAAFDHDAPLPWQAVDCLRALRVLTGRAAFLFPGQKSVRVPMSTSAISKLYRKLGYQGQHVPHGWRSSFSTFVNEYAVQHDKVGWREAADLMLAHAPKGISASEYAYNRAKFAGTRREIAQLWADHIARDWVPAMDLLKGQVR